MTIKPTVTAKTSLELPAPILLPFVHSSILTVEHVTPHLVSLALPVII